MALRFQQDDRETICLFFSFPFGHSGFHDVAPILVPFFFFVFFSRGNLVGLVATFIKKTFTNSLGQKHAGTPGLLSGTIYCSTLAVVCCFTIKYGTYRRSEGASAFTENKQTTFCLRGQGGLKGRCEKRDRHAAEALGHLAELLSASAVGDS